MKSNDLSLVFRHHIFIFSNLCELRESKWWPPKLLKSVILVERGLYHSILFDKNKVIWCCLYIQVWGVKFVLLQLQAIIPWLILMWRSSLKIQRNKNYKFLPHYRFFSTGLSEWTNTYVFFSLNLSSYIRMWW